MSRRGAACIFAALAAGLPIAAAPAQTPATVVAPSAAKSTAELPWFTGTYEQLGARAKAEQQAVFVVLGDPGNRWSARFERETLRDPALATALEGWLPWKVDLASESGALLGQRFAVSSLPLILFFDAQGRAVDRLDGYRTREQLLAEVERVLAGKDTLIDLWLRLAERPDDLELRARTAEKLGALGDASGRDQQLVELRRRDSQRKTLPMRRELLDAAMAKIQEHFDRTREINPGPLVRFLEQEHHAELLFQGHGILAGLHAQRARDLQQAHQLEAARSKRSDMRAVLAKAAQSLPEDPALRVSFTLEFVRRTSEHAGELSAPDRELILQLAGAAVDLAPEDAPVQACLAIASFLSGDAPAAAIAMRRAIELEPDNPEWLECARSMGL